MPQASKIEANFRTDKATKTAKPPRTQRRVDTPAVENADRQKPATEVLARETKSDAVPYSRTEFVVIMQTRIDGDGAMKTDFCVWKLTFRATDNRAIRAQIVTSSL
jgi:hypothetical protein